MQASGAGTPASLPLLGREDELAELRGGLDDATSGHGRIFLVAGEAGIGKTRLIEGLVHSTAATEVRSLWGRCREREGAPPFWPWVQVIRASIADRSRETVTRLLGPWGTDITLLLPELGDLVPGLGPAPPSESPDARLRLFEAVGGFVRTVASEGGGLIVALDDLHAADDASLQLLEHLAAEELANSNVLVVGSYRDVEARSSVRLHRRLAAIGRHARRLVLGGVEESSVRTIWRATTDEEPPDLVVRRVHDVTDGNPLFVQETARLLSGPQRQSISSGDVPLPEVVAGVIRQRLASVDEIAGELLACASVLGREFELEVLAALSEQTGQPEQPVDSVLHILESARPGGFVEEMGRARWAFTHGQIREVIYDHLPPSRRVELHRLAGKALERRLASEGGVHPAELAHHFFEAARAGDASKAVGHCTRAGDAAFATLAFEDAGLQYSRALEALALSRPSARHQRYELLVALAEAERRGGRVSEAGELYRRALKEARAIGSAELLARAVVGSAGLPESAVDKTRATVVQEAEAALPDGDSALRARLLLAAAATAEPEAGRQRSRRALEMARRVGDLETLREVLLRWHGLNQGSDALEERRAVAQELLRLCHETGDRERLVVARQCYGSDLFEAADIGRMRAELEIARREADRLRLPSLIWGVTVMQAALALLEFRLPEAEQLALAAAAAGERSELTDGEAVMLWQLSSIRREEGRFEEMTDLARQAADGRDGLATGTDRLLLALALAELERGEEARRELEAVVEQVLGGDPKWVAMLVDACWLLGEARWAQDSYDRLSAIRGRHVVVGAAIASLGSSDRYLGQAATLLERYDDAEAHFLAAHAWHERLGAPSWIAHGQADHARMLLRRNQPGDRARGHDLVQEASERYRTLGMKVHIGRLSELAGTAGSTSAGAAAERTVFRLEGEYWAVDYGGLQVRLRDSKGLRHLARLLASPGGEVHVLDLVVGRSSDPGRSRAAIRSDGLHAGRGGDAGAVLDPEAKEAYRRRITELREDIEEAEAYNDFGRAERAQQELDFVVAELSSALGMGGRDRKASSETERARQSATRAIRSAIDRVADAHPTLGEHLRTTVRTGIYCAYLPDPRAPIRWEL